MNILAHWIMRKTLKLTYPYLKRIDVGNTILSVFRVQNFYTVASGLYFLLRHNSLYSHPLQATLEAVLPKELVKLLSPSLVRSLLIWSVLNKLLRFGVLGVILLPFRTLIAELLINNIFSANAITSAIVTCLNYITLPWLTQIIETLTKVKSNVEPVKRHWKVVVSLTSIISFFGWFRFYFPDSTFFKGTWEVIERIFDSWLTTWVVKKFDHFIGWITWW